jgi:hypothetical protein
MTPPLATVNPGLHPGAAPDKSPVAAQPDFPPVWRNNPLYSGRPAEAEARPVHLVINISGADRNEIVPAADQPAAAASNVARAQTAPVAPTVQDSPAHGPGNRVSAPPNGYPVDGEAQAPALPDMARPGWTEFSARREHDHRVQLVTAHAMSTALTGNLDPAHNPDFSVARAALMAHVDSAISTLQSGNQNDPKIRSLGDRRNSLNEALATFDQHFGTLRETIPDFMATAAREKTKGGGFMDRAGDSLRRNLFGQEMSAVIARSALQALVVTGSTSALQLGISKALEFHFSRNPDDIPDALRQQVQEDMIKLGKGGAEPTNAEVIRHTIDVLSKPGSTYLDEAKAEFETIMGVEAGIGFVRGTILPIADSQNEIDGKKNRLQSAVDNAGKEKPEKSKHDKMMASMANSWPSQLKYNLISGAIAAVTQTALTSKTTGPMAVLEAGKVMTFAAIQAGGNVLADGIRARGNRDPDKIATQVEKGLYRTAFRTVAQVAKTGISNIQSAVEGSMDKRSWQSDVIRTVMMGAGSGALKESLGSLTQILVNSKLPADERAMLHTTKTINAAADVMRAVVALGAEGQGVINPALLADLVQPISRAFDDISTANNMQVDSAHFGWSFQRFAEDVNRAIEERGLARS